MAPLPPHRKDLLFREEDGRALVLDRRVGTVHALSTAEAAAVRALDGRNDVAAICRVSTLTPAKVRALVGRLEADHLLDTPDIARALDRYDADIEKTWLDTAEKNTRIRRLPVADDRTRWDCHGCGVCCRGLSVPLSQDEIARIDVSLYDDVTGGRSFHVPHVGAGAEKVERVLRQVGKDERCVFLARDGRCWVHARQGAAAKPDTCQLFPLATIVTSRGPRLTLRIACASLHESYEDGSSVARHAASSYALEHREPARGIFGGVLRRERVGFDAYEALEARLRALLDEHGASPRFVAEAVAILPGASTERHRADRRAVGRAIRARLQADATAPSPLIGWFGGKLQRSPALRRGLAGLEAGAEPPDLAAATARFVAATVRQVLWACEPYKMPDLQVGLRALLLVLEAILHAVGPKGSPAAASRATRVYWMAGFEDGELTPVLWEALQSSR